MGQRTETFPIVVKVGSSVVKIYQDAKVSGNYYRVVYHLGGKRHRLNFPNLEKAKLEAHARATQLARGDVHALQLTGKDRICYGRALDAIRELDIPLDSAATEYAEARKLLNGSGIGLTEAVRIYLRHHGEFVTGKPVADAVEAFKTEKRTEGRSKLYLDDLRYRLNGFTQAFNLEVRQLTSADVRDFLNSLNLAPRSFNNHRRALQTFFRFCQAHGWLSKEVDLLSTVGKRKEPASDIEVFTPDELRKILAAAPAKTALCIAIQAFAGVRSEELLRLTWKDTERRAGFVEITAGNAKTASRRLIRVSDNLCRWLAGAPREGTRVWPLSKPYLFETMRDAAKKVGVKWKANGLRHSFISYRLAVTNDLAKVALEAGNSPRIIFTNYRELATEAEAAEWFGIVPAGKPENVVRMPH